MKTILATAYAINPFKGSEDGMGWNYVLQIARFHKVIAITRKNNQKHIEKYQQLNPDIKYQNIQFLYFDLPYWMRFWKKGGRGAMLYYLLWQRNIIPFIEKSKLDFDIVHNLNFHNDWTPSYLWKLNKPFIWGSVGHHPLIPAQYMEFYSYKSKLKDRLTWRIKKLFWNYSRDLKKTIHYADQILCMNHGVPTTLGLSEKYSVFPSVASQDFGWNKQDISHDKFRIISAGRLVPIKGFDLTLHAFARFIQDLDPLDKKKCELTIVGSGPEEKRLKSLTAFLGISTHVQFIPWMERRALMALFKTSSAFLFPSHEGAGMVVAEALSFGLPVICLGNEGPGTFINSECGYVIPHGTYEETVSGLALAARKLYDFQEKRSEMRVAARQQFEKRFHWDRRGELLQEIYSRL
ncbi:MAG: glycosyltransferase family 4 protein [Cecembia sp.]